MVLSLIRSLFQSNARVMDDVIPTSRHSTMSTTAVQNGLLKRSVTAILGERVVPRAWSSAFTDDVKKLGDVKLMRGWLLRYDDDDVEAEFQEQLAAKNRESWKRFWIAGLLVVVIIFFAKRAFFWLGKNDPAALIAGLTPLVLLLAWTFCSVLILRKITRTDFVLYGLFFFTFLLTWLQDPFATSKMTNSSFFLTEVLPSCDADICHSHGAQFCFIVAVILAAHQFFELPSRHTWVLALAMYIACIILDNCGLFGTRAITVRIETAIGLAVCFYVSWRGRYMIELQFRFGWLEQSIMRQQLDLKERYLVQRSLRLKELEEQVAALQALQSSQGSLGFGGKGGAKKAAAPSIRSMNLQVDTPTLIFDMSAQINDLRPNALLVRAMRGKAADMARITRMAQQIRLPHYQLKEFYEDCLLAFPELQLYFAVEVAIRSIPSAATTSGIAADEEYQRTIGALFAVYWLLRLDIDGMAGFCYGVDEDWATRAVDHNLYKDLDGVPFFQMSDGQKRVAFFNTMDWSKFQELVNLAGCLTTDRIATLLCLTSFHDIMKVTSLRPVVEAAHAPYFGYKAGEEITDHDLALSYVLEHFGHILPSFTSLPPGSQRSVIFTQSKLNFNHGWFVQAEAPPGAMLRSMKSVLQNASPGDLSFYFLHWLTDLAGAEGTPRGGAEKFVLKFPHAVLGSFLWSIPYLQKLENMTETDTVECYLEARWKEEFPWDNLPEGIDAIARLRLSIMAQTGSKEAVYCFNSMPLESRKCLAEEMARTGVLGQTFRRSPVQGGPAFLVYYGPALLQRSAGKMSKMKKSLALLKAVYEAGRCLWPVSQEQSEEYVTLQCGTLKNLEIEEIFYSDPDKPAAMWVMIRNSNREAGCELCSAAEINALIKKGTPHWLLDLQLPT